MKFLRLALKNKEAELSSWDDLYGNMVSREFRKIYSIDKCEAIVNNYLDDPTNEKYVSKFREMQSYRRMCKEKAKKDMQTY